ncbi:UNKNOWN [Stylonychia lemnae]|uniref:Uncharacterized protein n=1 Tax=Stylonychia lemnae TaxID=5949 RepID=A0A078A062_STYLE|nr:UNKNOWN [Stylonychia lemnae]|eukprot:CDW74168.1 UNKNOWN [Stylonychia lemnae]
MRKFCLQFALYFICQLLVIQQAETQDQCSDIINGCQSCQIESTSDRFSLKCLECQSGLSILTQTHISGDLRNEFSLCVPDCARAHQSFSNNLATSMCTCNKINLRVLQGVVKIAKIVIVLKVVLLARDKIFNRDGLTLLSNQIALIQIFKYAQTVTPVSQKMLQYVHSVMAEASELFPLTESELSSDINCMIFDFEKQYNCLQCKPGYYLNIDGYFNATTNRNQDICLSSQWIFYLSKQCNQETGSLIKTLKCSLKLDSNGVDVIQDQILACLDGYVDSKTGQCVTNCGIGRYGSTSFNYKSMIDTSQCLDCDSSCYECSSQFECKSCKKGYFLNLIDGKNTGTCLLKEGQFESTIYVQTRYKLDTAGIIDGSIVNPYLSLQDALTAAYILGSPYESATITILLFSNQSHSMIRYQSNLGIFKNQGWLIYLRIKQSDALIFLDRDSFFGNHSASLGTLKLKLKIIIFQEKFT